MAMSLSLCYNVTCDPTAKIFSSNSILRLNYLSSISLHLYVNTGILHTLLGEVSNRMSLETMDCGLLSRFYYQANVRDQGGIYLSLFVI